MEMMEIILWILAAVLVLSGIKKMFSGDFLLGLVFIVVGLLVGPGGTSLFV
jgi:type III secretory pathway component EscR